MLTGQNGILNRVVEAKGKTENAKNDERDELEKMVDSISVFRKNSLASNVKIGDYIEYLPDIASTENILKEVAAYSGNTDNAKNTESDIKQEINLKWQVLDVDNGKVRIISETPTVSKITFKGAKGYNNAVYLLDKMCSSLYSKFGYSKKIENLKIEDIQKYLNYDYTEQENQYADTGKYGGTKEYVKPNIYYPNLLVKEKTNLLNKNFNVGLNFSEQESPINEEFSQLATNLKVKQTFWKKKIQENDFSSSVYYNIFAHNMGYYWLSSRGVGLGNSRAYYCIRIAGHDEITGYDLYMSDNDWLQATWSFRPVITLNSDVLVKSGDGTMEFPYEITLEY